MTLGSGGLPGLLAAQLPEWHGGTTCLTRRVPIVSNPAQPSDSADPWDAPDPALALALQQLRWYARHRNRARISYEIIEILLLVMTATTTVAAALKASAWITAVLAASTVVLAGLSKVLDSHDSWVGFGSAWAELQVAVNDYRLMTEAE